MPTRTQNLQKAVEAAKGVSTNAFEQLQGQIDAILKYLTAKK